MTKQLFFRAVAKYCVSVPVVGALTFLPAGTLKYGQGWLLMGVLSVPLILGSLPGFIVMLMYPVLIARRIGNEEAVLRRELPGYADYQKKVRWRLVPGIW